MKWGILGVNVGRACWGAGARELATAAEEHGFESLWAVEHVVVPVGYTSVYPYSERGRIPGGDDAVFTDPLQWLSFAAACTTTIRLGTGILILPERHPLLTAKEVASIDTLSDGRVILGVGIGWLREEMEALGVPWARRAERTEEYVAALRAAWTNEVASFSGEFVSWGDLYVRPLPDQRPVPIVIGGSSEAAADRAGRIGDGYFPYRVTPPQLAHLLSVMRRAAERAGRDPDTIEVTTNLGHDPALAPEFEAAGAARLLVTTRTSDEIEVFARRHVSG